MYLYSLSSDWLAAEHRVLEITACCCADGGLSHILIDCKMDEPNNLRQRRFLATATVDKRDKMMLCDVWWSSNNLVKKLLGRKTTTDSYYSVINVWLSPLCYWTSGSNFSHIEGEQEEDVTGWEEAPSGNKWQSWSDLFITCFFLLSFFSLVGPIITKHLLNRSLCSPSWQEHVAPKCFLRRINKRLVAISQANEGWTYTLARLHSDTRVWFYIIF